MIRVSGAAPNVLGLMLNPVDVMVEMQKSEGNTGAMWWTEYLAFGRGVTAHLDFYREMMHGDHLPLSLRDRHALALEASRATGCTFCAQHHEEILDQDVPDETETDDDCDDDNEDKAALLAELASVLSRDPTAAVGFRERFRSAGFTAAQFQHAIFVVSYCNFASRCALAMELVAEDDEAPDEATSSEGVDDDASVDHQ
mmetsp:Transcript_2778/g.7185  ORF Transcript_2778/g.7185 Transcript_2778/m.7185 type:complete len:199 (-) Transcript_2778:443-1039(-)|eukprot:CAMPEP_0197426472 /NCGR_PEP_ID=MMETSP1170-20131217/34952_1 /TAXON_ID=54406 /ORGANISM="Sarcinochrysis sp, Strain CCMP770" /LENGTH=198 /DNA_ID=CAMNT_0042954107 /DNA_START=146 /DNA_END=742 /DNA_ORIENTATION=+